MRHVLAAVLLLSCTPSIALAWGELGHRTVAEIAARYLTEQAAAEVQDLLGGGPYVMAEVSVWADGIRIDRPETSYWHVVEIPPNVDERKEWEQGTSETWANESFHDFVTKHGLLDVRWDKVFEDEPIILPTSVIDEVKPIVARRLKMAGVRLAWLLNQVLR
jgi:hypothetical protein